MRASFTRLLLLFALAAVGAASPAAAQPPNIQVSSPSSSNPEEITISVDPTNPLRLVAGANDNYRYVSSDGGLHWSQAVLQSSLGVFGDPVVLYDAAGDVHYAHLSESFDRIVVQTSGDGGISWNDGVGVGLNTPPKNEDKPGLATDLSGSAYQGSLYLAWTEFDSYGSVNPADSTRILLSRSTDHGLTWSTPVRVSDLGGDCLDFDNTVEGAIPAVGPEGQVYVAWSGPGGIRFDRSLDGGATFGNDVFVSSQPGGWDFDVSGIQRCNGLPTTLCDISNSPYRGRIYVVWSDQRAGTGDTDVFMARSSDGGTTWSAPTRVNDDATTSQQFFPAAAVDPITGNLYVLYYDRRATIGDATQVSLARSADGGDTFQSVQVSDSSFTPDASVFFGDYIGLAAWNRRIYPAWMRMDGGNLSVWTAPLTDSLVAVSVPPRLAAESVILHAIPNPIRLATSLQYSIAEAGQVSIRIFDARGREVAQLADGHEEAGPHAIAWDARGHPSGLYFCTLTTQGRTKSAKLLVIH